MHFLKNLSKLVYFLLFILLLNVNENKQHSQHIYIYINFNKNKIATQIAKKMYGIYREGCEND